MSIVAPRILLVDDHPVFRMGLRQLLADEFSAATFGEAGNAGDAVELVMAARWDLAIVDINIPGRGGMDVLREIKRLRPSLPVLVVSMHPEDQFALRVLRAGGAGYVTKDRAPEELTTASRTAMGGEKYVSATVAALLASDVTRAGCERPHEALSDREFEILTLIGSGRTVSEIAARLSLSVKTVSSYRTRILQKMRLDNNAQLTAYAIRHGLVC